MIKCYDDDDNIVTTSVHNAEMISAYLRNFAIDYESYLTDEQYGVFTRCGDLLWIMKKHINNE